MSQAVSHYEIVGSFLRPQALKKAREEFFEQKISAEKLKSVADQEITKLIAKQKALGLEYVSDGEFRRSYWHLDFFWGFTGVEHHLMDQGYLFHGEETRADSARLSGKITFNPAHSVFDEYSFAAEIAAGVKVRQSIPAPAQFLSELLRGSNEEAVNRFYPDREELYHDNSCAYYRVPFANIRGISDIVGENAAATFEKNLKIACEHAFIEVQKIAETALN